jgi:uncharacterized DUF497 family protein
VDIEWDARKAAANLRKHGIDFADAATVLEDDLAVTVIDQHLHEDRFVTVGMDALGRTLVVVCAYRGDVIRLISARHPTSRERRQYEAGR